MAKRFTDTDKWKREWFSELDPKAKLVWIYLLDQCDHCGIWPRNMRLLSDQTGLKVDEQQFQAWFGSKVILFDTDKYFIPSFFEFQYGHSKDDFKAKRSAVSSLVKMGLMNDDGSVRNTKEHLPKSSEQSMDCPSIGKSTSKSNINTGESEGKQNFQKEIEEIYSKIYPLKKGKSKGVKKLLSCKGLSLDNLRKAATNYRDECIRLKTAPDFIKHFSTFANEWEDWIDFVPPVDPKPESPKDWTGIANRIWNLCNIHSYSLSPTMRELLGPDLVAVVKASGELYELRTLKKDDFAIKSFAARLKAAHEALSQQAVS